MTLNNFPRLELADAIARGHSTFEVLFEDWGVIVTAGDFSNTQYPAIGQRGIAQSIAGVAIGPRSDVDRCWFTYQAIAPQGVSSFADQLGLNPTTDRVRRLSVCSPFFTSQAAFEGAAQYAQQSGVPSDVPNGYDQMFNQGLMYFYAANLAQGGVAPNSTRYAAQEGSTLGFGVPALQTTVLPSTYRGYDGNAKTFGAGYGLFTRPLLHLVMYLKPPVVAPPAKRFPYHRAASNTLTTAAEKCIAQIPIFGRKHVRISSWNGDYLRAGLLRGVNQGGDVYEAKSTLVTSVPALVKDIEFENPCADYLVLYTANALAGVGPVIVNYEVSATD